MDAVTQNMESEVEKGGKNPAAVTFGWLGGNKSGHGIAKKSQTRKTPVAMHAKKPKRGKNMARNHNNLLTLSYSVRYV